MKKTLKITYIVLGVLLALAIGASLILSNANKPLDRSDSALISITVEQGETTSDIAGNLEKSGIIDSSSKYELISRIWRYDGKYVPGTYSVSPSMTKSDIAKILTSGSKDLMSFSVPPGLDIYEVADLLSGQGLVDRDEFIYELENGDYSQFDFLDEAQDGPSHLEGYLFPNTYYLDEGASENDFITTMLNQFDLVFTDEYSERAEELGYSTNDIIIIASLIEREAKNDNEKPDIAAVIYERISEDEPLGLSSIGEYQGKGLPPGPVCSPGEASILAALYPSETEE